MERRAFFTLGLRATVGLGGIALGLRPAIAGAEPRRFPAGSSMRYAAEQFERRAGRDPGVDWEGDAGQWYDQAQNWKRIGTPRAPVRDAIAVWRSDGPGHVAIVRSFTAGGVTVEEMGWEAPKRITTTTLFYDDVMRRGAYSFVGYIYPVRLAMPLVPAALSVTVTSEPTRPASPPAPALPEPADLQARARANGTVELAWVPVPGALAYALQRREPGASWGEIATIHAAAGDGRTFVDFDVTAGRRYQYRVRALGADARSSWSDLDSSTAR